MDIKFSQTLPGPIDAIALDADGGQLAASARDDDQQAAVHIYGLSGHALEIRKVLPTADYGAGRATADECRVQFESTRLAFRDARTVLIARSVEIETTDQFERKTELVGIDLGSGGEVGHFETPDAAVMLDLLLLSPTHALLGKETAATCVDVRSFREAWNAQTVGEGGGTLGEDEQPDEQAGPDAYVYDADAGRLYVLSGEFNQAYLQCYDLPSPERGPSRLWWRRVLQGHEPPGLCLNPGGGGVTASFQIVDELIDFSGQRIADYGDVREALLARRLEMRAEPPPPPTARLGCLGILAAGESRWIDIYSALDRDFLCGALWAPAPNHGPRRVRQQSVVVGYRLSAGTPDGENKFMTRPVYISTRQVVVGTPGGLLIRADTYSMHAEEVHDLESLVQALAYCPQRHWLFAGCRNGTLTVLTNLDGNRGGQSASSPTA